MINGISSLEINIFEIRTIKIIHPASCNMQPATCNLNLNRLFNLKNKYLK